MVIGAYIRHTGDPGTGGNRARTGEEKVRARERNLVKNAHRQWSTHRKRAKTRGIGRYNVFPENTSPLAQVRSD